MTKIPIEKILCEKDVCVSMAEARRFLFFNMVTSNGITLHVGDEVEDNEEIEVRGKLI